MGGDLIITERNRRESCLGPVLQIKVFAPGYRALSWSEVWRKFVQEYPGRWAVQCFPPVEDLIDGKAVYHLFVCDSEPEGLNIRKG
jgi:hypothetical protein